MNAAASIPVKIALYPDKRDISSELILACIAAHLSEFALSSTVALPGVAGLTIMDSGRITVDDAAAAVVIGDVDRCDQLTGAGVPAVFVRACGEPGTRRPDGSVALVCRQGPWWRTEMRARAGHARGSEIEIEGIGPYRRVRSVGGGGAILALTGVSNDDTASAAIDLLGEALWERPAASWPDPWHVVTDLPPSHHQTLRQLLPASSVRFAGLGELGDLARRADVLLSTPTLVAAAHAQVWEVPLVALPSVDARSERVRGFLADLAGADQVGSGFIEIGVEVFARAVIDTAPIGAQQVARQLRQICLAPL